MSISAVSNYSHFATSYSSYQVNRQAALEDQQSASKIGVKVQSEFSKAIEKTISSSNTFAGSIAATIGLPTTYAEAMKASTAPQMLNYYV